MFILSKWVRITASVNGPQFALDFPNLPFMVEPERQKCNVGDMVRLHILPSHDWDCFDFTPEQRGKILERYEEVN